MTVHVLLTGHVQGVGFRQFIKYKAKKLNVKGWIENLPASRQGGPDGRVEALFEGSPENVKKMVEISKRGPFLARVKDIEIDWNSQESADIIDFVIIK